VRRFVVTAALVLCGLCGWTGLRGQGTADGARWLERADIKAAIKAVRRGEPTVLREQMEICAVPAPLMKEATRGALLKRKFEALGLTRVRVDEAGNVLGERPGRRARPNLVLTAHLDTVFPAGTAVTPKRDGRLISAPGIADDARGLAVLLGVIRALDAAKVQTEGTITFVATVGEEGLGNLHGVRELFDRTLKGAADAFVSVDGSGLDVTNVGVGSHRYRVTFKGPGGHSFGDFGLANPVHALGRAVAQIADLEVPSSPRTTFNVGRIGGGTSINSIAYESWMEVDMRSADPTALAGVDARFHEAVDRALEQENARWDGRGRLAVTKDLVGDRPPGRTPPDSAIVRTALDVTRALGHPPELGEGSTDANYPMSLTIPAITIGGGGSARGAHSLSESFDSTESWQGTARALALAVALVSRERGVGRR
jgi:acetylornithine deacetylase/succinyl-diaminopimelate desuccinylase-like protein